MDLFSSQELDEELVAAMNEAAKRLPKASGTSQLPKADRLRLSVLPQARRHSESDESDEDDGMDTPPARKVVKDGDNPVLSLQPVRVMTGFNCNNVQ